jgi:cardiolipin synthase
MTAPAPRLFSRSQLLTWPNLVTLLRLVAIPIFVWLLFGRHNRAAAAWLLGALGSTDWVDGWLARRFRQTTELGAMFDPVVDRLLFFVAIPCLMIDRSVPLAFAVVLLVREAVVALMAILVKGSGAPRLIVTWEGKTGTFLMMFALPLFLGHRSTLSYAPVLIWLAWLFGLPGLGYSWYSALFQYLPATRATLGPRAGPPPAGG